MEIPLILQQPDEILKTLSKRFKERRLLKKISQADLAEKSEVGIAKIRRLEQNGNIQLLDLIKLLDAIGEIDEIHKFMDFSSKIKNEMELDMLINFEKKKPKRARSKKRLKDDAISEITSSVRSVTKDDLVEQNIRRKP